MLARGKRPPDAVRIASWMSEISLRLATPSDHSQLERLATLDQRQLPPAPLLIARCDGESAAAISLATGEIVADPFRRTLELQSLLRCHAAGARLDRDALGASLEARHPAPQPAEVGTRW